MNTIEEIPAEKFSLTPIVFPVPLTEEKQIEVIRETVASQFGILVEHLNVPSRKKPLVTIRHLAMLLCAELTPATRITIGRKFGRHHSDVTHSLASFKRICETESHWALNFFEAARRCRLALGRSAD